MPPPLPDPGPSAADISSSPLSSPPGSDDEHHQSNGSPGSRPAIDLMESIHISSPQLARTAASTRATRAKSTRKIKVPAALTQAAASARPKVSFTRKPKKSKWDPETVLTDSKSPLATADLRDMLTSPTAWESLSPADRSEVLALFPGGHHVLGTGTADAAPNWTSLISDDNFRHDCARYAENIAQGRHDDEWLEQAWAAHERRAAGDFDDFLARKFEEDWGVAVPDHLRPRRTAATSGSAGGTAETVAAITVNDGAEEQGSRGDEVKKSTNDADGAAASNGNVRSDIMDVDDSGPVEATKGDE